MVILSLINSNQNILFIQFILGKYTVGVNTRVNDENMSITPHINFKLNDDIVVNANTSITIDNDRVTISTNTGMTYKISPNYSFGIFFNTTSGDYNVKMTWLILNLGVYGYSFKIPFFLGNTQEDVNGKEGKTYSMCLTAGIVATANIFWYLWYSYLRRAKKNKRYTELDVAFRKFQEKYDEAKEIEIRLIRELTQDNYGKFYLLKVIGDLSIMDAYIGHKNHVRQIAHGKKELYDPPVTTEQYQGCQVQRIKFKLQSKVRNSTLVINKDILTEEGVFNPRVVSGDVAVYIHFKYR